LKGTIFPNHLATIIVLLSRLSIRNEELWISLLAK